MEIRLEKMRLRNFKGITELEFAPGGKNAIIRGDNATGKTTVVDAWAWLLFDKDSQGKKDFQIKTLVNGEPVHNLEHEVEGVLLVDGKPLALRKVFAEKWTKKRGQAQAEFTGHTTDYFIDDVPVKKSEYEARIAEMIDEDLFKLLTSPSYFNEQLHWTKRREIILDVCGDLKDEEVIASDGRLKKLSKILNGKKIDDYKAILAGKRRKINDELTKIPVRIDEATRRLPDISSINPETITADIELIKKNIAEKQAELARVENGGEIAEKVKQLREVEAELLQIKNEFKQKIDEQVYAKLRQYEEIRAKISELEPLATLRDADFKSEEKQIQALRDEWHKVNTQEYDGSDTCPTCGQNLPDDMIEKAMANFNRQKAERLEQITAEGKKLKAEVDALRAQIKEHNKKAREVQLEINKLNEQFELIKSEIGKLRNTYVEDTPEYAAKAKEKTELEKTIAELRAGSAEITVKIKNDIQTYETALAGLLESQQKVKAYNDGKARITELEAQQKQLAKEFEKLEEELFLCEEFTRVKVAMLEEKINNRFKFARFKMFNQFVNGGIEECCETLYEGVPYSSGLNSGHKIIVGLDIINTLSEHYGFRAPIWIDNAESVTKFPEMNAQIIRLEVSAKHKKLDVEVCE